MLKSLARLLPLALLTGLAAPVEAQVVTTVKPLTLIAAAVTEGIETPRQLLPEGVSAHDYSLRPSDRLQLQQADLIIWVGPAHERFLESVLTAKPNLLTVSRLPGLTILPLRRLEDGAALPGTLDSHLWLDPENAIRIARVIAGKRAEQDPTRAARYRANADRFADRLRRSWQPLQQRIAALPRRDYVAYHDAYQYLERGLGLHFTGSLSVSPEARPGARHLLTMKQRVKERQVRCLVREPGSSPALLQQVAQPGGRQMVLDETFREAGDFVQGLTGMAVVMENCLKP